MRTLPVGRELVGEEEVEPELEQDPGGDRAQIEIVAYETGLVSARTL